MSNFFGFSDSLGKSYGKEVVSDFAIFARKWSKIAARKKVYFGLFFNYHLILHFTGRIEAAHQGDLLWLLALVTCGLGVGGGIRYLPSLLILLLCTVCTASCRM